MQSLLTHRGPDDQGTYVDRDVGLANTRLSIIDLKDGHQPLSNEDSQVWVTFNGEIFNFQEHKARLIHSGHVFKTRSDTEVLVHLYEEKGPSFLSELDGMFAFALWDANAKALLLARDYAGMKPLYYTLTRDGTLYFASEVKAVSAVMAVHRLDLIAVSDFLVLGYVPSERTLLEGVHKLRPGQILRKDRYGISLETYHDFLRRGGAAQLGDYKTSVRNTLENATESWLMSDVPVGAYLSGGLDSSLIAALAARKIGPAMTTFTAWFGADYPNELTQAKEVADYLGINHSEVTVDPTSVVQELTRIAWMCDEPIADAAIIPTYFVSKKAASAHIKVVLAGEGADEIFGGYPWYRLFRYSPLVRLSTGQREPTSTRHFRHVNARISSLVWPGYSLADRYLLFHSVLHPAMIRKLLPHGPPGNARACFAAYLERPSGTLLSRLLVCDIMTLLAEDFLMKADKGSMANSVEERVPYLAKSMIELGLQIPDDLKVSLSEEKIILRRAAEGILPQATLKRRKRGYGTPVAGWIRGEIGDYLFAKIEASETINKLLGHHFASKVLSSRALRWREFWLLGSLALWESVHFADGGLEIPTGL